jgi:N-acetylneuraminic acid mutarotase
MKTKDKTSGHIIRSIAVVVVLLSALITLASAFNWPNKSPHLSSPLPLRGSGEKPATQTKTLTFTNRVAYQRAIEEVYWRHRIWPKENHYAKPSLDKVMPQAAIESKVKDYLHNSQLLEQYWQKPITSEQLQAEMERMAHHSKQPQVLREIFAALGNDPTMIAECLARPTLAERLVTTLYAHDERFHGELRRRAEAELATHSSVQQMKQTSGEYSEIEWIKSDTAEASSALAHLATVGRAVRMTGSEWQEKIQNLAAAFGNAKTENAFARIDTGVLSPLHEDDEHYYATAVISKGKDQVKVATVAWMKEPVDSWHAKAETQMPQTMAALIPAKYTLPTIEGPSVDCTDTWIATSTTNAPDGRTTHAAVWTGSEMIVWGGYDGTTYFNTGARYNPSTDSWTATSSTNAPTVRANPTGVWTGSEMIVWGGYNGAYLNTGARYNPGTDSWIATSTTNAPAGRTVHTAVWTGSEMIVWGGTPDGTTFLNTGGRYNPSADSWTTSSTANAPVGRGLHTAVWTGSQMIVWGGYDGTNVFNSGGRYNPATNSWTSSSTANAPAGRNVHTAVWTGTEMIVWGGSNSTGILNSGGRYNPSADSWMATGSSNVPAKRLAHTAVWTGSEMIVWGGADATAVLNTGGRYNTGTDSWTATSITNAPGSRGFHTAVWTGSEMIVWGGANDTFVLNTGGRYCGQSSHPAFFSGEVSLGNGVYYLQFPNGTPFGYYSYLTDARWFYHFDMGYEYWFDANDGHNGIYFYDLASTHFFYTSPSFPFPYLYDFSFNTVLYYFPDPNNPGHYTSNPRYFYNFATGQIITM